jgi:transcriptional regulator with XRE-family HTH domain
MSDDLRLLGRWIERERIARNWSRPRLADLAGVSTNTVYHIERGDNSRTVYLFALIEALDGRFSLKTTRESVQAAQTTQDIA